MLVGGRTGEKDARDKQDKEGKYNLEWKLKGRKLRAPAGMMENK